MDGVDVLRDGVYLLPEQSAGRETFEAVERDVLAINGTVFLLSLPERELRFVVQLLKLAYIECRVAGRNRIEVEDLHKAYRSSAYTTSVTEVEELQLQAIAKAIETRIWTCAVHLICLLNTSRTW